MLVIFDDLYREEFYPLTHLRVTGDLRCGILKLRQRLELLFSGDEDSTYLIPDELQALYQTRHPDWQTKPDQKGTKLYLNSRLVIDDNTIKAIRSLEKETAIINESGIVAINTEKCLSISDLLALDISNYANTFSAGIRLYSHPAELVHDNDRMIRFDFDLVYADKDNYFETEPGVTVLHPYNVWIGEDATLKPGVVLDASDGPIVIDDNALIMANAVLIGPCYIGKRSVIKIGAKIYQSCSIGPVCKIGGEVEGSIIQAFSNKQHDGFLGHSYLGEWVNIGADTNNSDLKNTYKNVQLYSYKTKSLNDTGTRFMGCLIGDHTKLGINSTINTGAVIGTGANLWGRELISGFIPDFSWGQADDLSKYRMDAFFETARLVKERRNLSLTQAEEELLVIIHKHSMET